MVDGPFVRSWVIHHARAKLALRYIDPDSGSVVPLFYMGSWRVDVDDDSGV